MTKRLAPLTALLAVLLVAGPQSSTATTIAAPRDLGQLTHISQAVAFAEALDSWVEAGDTIPSTVTRFRLLEKVAGADPGAMFEVREPGGSRGKTSASVAGSPRFRDGGRYLLFLDRSPHGGWRSQILSYGLLEETHGGGLLKPLSQAVSLDVVPRPGIEKVGVYRKRELLDHLRQVGRGARWDARKAAAAVDSLGVATAADQTAPASPPDCAFLTDGTDNLPIRWFGYETGATTSTVIATTPGQTGIADGGASAVEQGTAAWRNYLDAVIPFNYGGTQPRSITCSANFDFQRGAVVFNDPCNDLADLKNCVGTLAFGGAIYDNTRTQSYDGAAWHPAFSLFVVVNNGTECVGETSFKEVLTHELGHTQGFGHHHPANPADATMSAFLKNDGRGAAIASVDKLCASYAYHTFLDVPISQPFWRQIEAIKNAGLTNGCANALYCPGNNLTRAEVAKFFELGIHGQGFAPPAASGSVFADVPASYWAAPWIEQLYRDGLTKGCNAGHYCPELNVLRSEMAVFLLRQRYGSSYVPPPATGTVFGDVPASYWAAPWIEQLYRDGLTKGCSANPLRYCPEDRVTRDQMAGFLVQAFNLPLP